LTGPPRVEFNHVAEDFFSAFDVPLVVRALAHGRGRAERRPPIIVNQTFVRRVLGNRDADRHARCGSSARAARTRSVLDTEPWHEIVGVAGDLSTNPIDPELVRPARVHALDTDDGSARRCSSRSAAGGRRIRNALA
jgi:hypothetical protein